MQAGLGDSLGGAFGNQFRHGKVVVGVDAKRACGSRGSRLCRKAEFRHHSGGAQRGHPVKNFAPRQSARISSTNFSMKLVDSHKGGSFICEIVAHSQKGFFESQVTERFRDHTYPSLLFQAQLFLCRKKYLRKSDCDYLSNVRNIAVVFRPFLLLMWVVP